MTDSAIKYVGVDGCPCGWIGIGLDDDGRACVKVREAISDIVACFGDACVILVDIPIGLLEEMQPGGRDCDKEARKKLGRKRQGAVFSAPPRPFVNKVMQTPAWKQPKSHNKAYEEAYAEAKKWHKGKFHGKRITSQAFGITPKIGEMDKYLPKHLGADSPMPTIREVHPEICFWALNGGNSDSAMANSKKKSPGFCERIDVLRRCARYVNGIDVDAIYEEIRCRYMKKQVADDDILDALAAAITAKIGSQEGNEFRTLPENPPTDSKGLSMEMVYALPNDEGTPC